MMPTKFSKAWVEIDPALKHGGIPNELHGYVGPDLGDNPTTVNPDCLAIFMELQSVIASVSMAPESMSEAQPGRGIVEESLNGLNAVFEKIVDVTHTDATKFHAWRHAIPPNLDFKLAPIRFPLRNPFANEFVHYGIGALVEVAELNRNANHSGLDPQSGNGLIAPLYYWKSKVMKIMFDLEVAGEISMNEMIDLFQGKYRPGPTVSKPDESAERADGDAVLEALSGTDVLQWTPNDVEWATFGNLNMKRFIPERTFQPEGAYPTTEDVRFEQTVDARDGSSTISTASQP